MVENQLEIITRCFGSQSFHIHNKFIDYYYLNEVFYEMEMRGDDPCIDDLYPFFIKQDELIVKLEKYFNNIKWQERGRFGSSNTDKAIINFLITPVKNKNEVRQFIHATVIYSDQPFDDLKGLCRTYGWNLFHLNSFSYLDIHSNNPCEPDFLNFPKEDNEK